MATIGHFTKKIGDKAPDYRVFAGRCEIGAAWKKTSEAGAGYLSVSIDDPSFPAPVICRLHETAQGFELIWSRS